MGYRFTFMLIDDSARFTAQGEGQRLQRIVRRGSTSSVRYRRAMMILASAGGNRVPVIAQLVQADEDTVREVIHRFNEIGLACLDPHWVGGRPRLLGPDQEDLVVATATTSPTTHFGPLRQFTLANSQHSNHTVQTRALHAYLRWRNANARHPEVLAAQRRERARIRSEKGIRWGGRPLTTAA
jgi:transposase